MLNTVLNIGDVLSRFSGTLIIQKMVRIRRYVSLSVVVFHLEYVY